MRSILIVCAMAAVSLGMAERVCAADPPKYRRDVPEKLAAEAKVSETAAVSAAQRAVPKGSVVALELEREKGVLIYSIDLKVPGTEGVTEVEVDAANGKVIGTEHESSSEEAKEQAAEKKQPRI